VSMQRGRAVGGSLMCRRPNFLICTLAATWFDDEEYDLPLTFLPAPPSLPTPVSTQSKLDIRPQKPVEKARNWPKFRTLSSLTKKLAIPSRLEYTRTMISMASASSNCARKYSRVRTMSSSAKASPP
jgi:hypothetical protein